MESMPPKAVPHISRHAGGRFRLPGEWQSPSLMDRFGCWWKDGRGMSTTRPFRAHMWLFSAIVCGVLTSSASATKIIMKDGRTLEGNVAELSTMVDKPIAAREKDPPKATLVIL